MLKVFNSYHKRPVTWCVAGKKYIIKIMYIFDFCHTFNPFPLQSLYEKRVFEGYPWWTHFMESGINNLE